MIRRGNMETQTRIKNAAALAACLCETYFSCCRIVKRLHEIIKGD